MTADLTTLDARPWSPLVDVRLGCRPTAWWGRRLEEVVHPNGLPLVAELLEAVEELWHRALHDPLTGLANRALFLDRLEAALERCGQGSAPPAVLYLDLDDFKPINDRLGHEVGDTVLVELARRLRGCVRASDTVARLGGDEFAILLEEIDSPEVAAATVERILRDLRSPIPLDSAGLTVSASVGMAIGSPVARSADELLRRADMAMYSVKNRRKTA